ncbi:IclR family transcriptional regulator [Actinomadura montaniterrae]|uniref:IclR family transcriptional regulator n=1 Tax=Actinomadura montaniterrae TaxID=1803903 RepID=A0A6L3VVM9_9ACTN|nr:IclR family transcriptional regulator [Actinomadura montaniterrae]KAB2378933.1 IclR family transcriptional regulator [Actinomadura montaniterrae]
MSDGAINRTLRVLATVCEAGPQTLTVLSAKTGLTPPTLLRTLRLMRDEGYVTQDEDRKWRATMQMWRLGCAVKDSTGLNELAGRTLGELVAEIEETVVFAAFENGWLTYLAQVEPDKPVRAHVPLGGHYAALDTTTGHAVMAWLPKAEIDAIVRTQARPEFDARARRELYRELAEVAQRGVASGSGDRWPGVWGAASAVFDHRGVPIGAVGVSIPGRGEPERAGAVSASVLQAARRFTQQLGGTVPAPGKR